jgi:hypothetical protein
MMMASTTTARRPPAVMSFLRLLLQYEHLSRLGPLLVWQCRHVQVPTAPATGRILSPGQVENPNPRRLRDFWSRVGTAHASRARLPTDQSNMVDCVTESSALPRLRRLPADRTENFPAVPVRRAGRGRHDVMKPRRGVGGSDGAGYVTTPPTFMSFNWSTIVPHHHLSPAPPIRRLRETLGRTGVRLRDPVRVAVSLPSRAVRHARWVIGFGPARSSRGSVLGPCDMARTGWPSAAG